MGDVHFLLQNGMTGLVMFATGILAAWILVPEEVIASLMTLADNTKELIIAFVAAPLLGVIVQPVAMWFYHYRKGRHPSDNLARRLLAEYLSSRIAPCRQEQDCFSDGKTKLADMEKACSPFAEETRCLAAQRNCIARHCADDVLFIPAYYAAANSQLIDWARRRQDWWRLWQNWSVATVIGVAAGLVIEGVRVWKDGFRTLEFLSGGEFWFHLLAVVIVAIGLAFVAWLLRLQARHARNDLDAFEYVCAARSLGYFEEAYGSLKSTLLPKSGDEK